MQEIILLTDYQNKFGSKHNASTYRGGMDLTLIDSAFEKHGYSTNVIPFYNVNFRDFDWKGKFVLYTSLEDIGYHYKSYIEDIIHGIELSGANVIPSFKYLRAHNNKVFMEIIRDLLPSPVINNLNAKYYGCFEETLLDSEKFEYPVVLKSAEGAMSKNVLLADNKHEFEKGVKKLSSTRNLKQEIRDYIRSIKHKGYQRQSKFRKKFIVQNFISDLTNDYKILVFGNNIYVSERKVRKNDFRASGSGLIQFGSKVELPKGLLEYARTIKRSLNVPFISIDVVLDNDVFKLIEFQSICFGTSVQWRSDSYYQFRDGRFVKKENNKTLEEVFVESIVDFINQC